MISSTRGVLLAVAAGFGLQACAATQTLVPVPVTVRVWRPAEITLKETRKIAVLDFQGTPELTTALRGALVSSLFEGGKYTVLERAEMQKILEEQRLTGQVIDERVAQRVGKMLGVDALMIGELSGGREDEGTRAIQPPARMKGAPKTPKTEETPPETSAQGEPRPEETFRTLTAYMTVSFRVVHVGTGELIAAKTLSLKEVWAENKTSVGNPTESLVPQEKFHYTGALPSPLEALKDLSVKAGQACAKMVSPYAEEVTLEYERGAPLLEKGFRFLENNLIKEAIESWEAALKKRPDDPSVNYNIGVFYESQGDLNKAMDFYYKAMEIRQDSMTMKAVSRIRQRAEEAERLRAQTPSTPKAAP